MRKILLVSLIFSSIALQSMNMAIHRNNFTPQNISYFSHSASSKSDIKTILKALKEFLYKEGLYDAAEIVTAIESNIADNILQSDQ